MKENPPDMPDKSPETIREILERTRAWITDGDDSLNAARRAIAPMESIPKSFKRGCLDSHGSGERYLKAFLLFSGVVENEEKLKEYGHGITNIIAVCAKKDSDFVRLRPDGVFLNKYKRTIDYPDQRHMVPKEELAQEAVTRAERIREFVLRKLEELGYREI